MHHIVEPDRWARDDAATFTGWTNIQAFHAVGGPSPVVVAYLHEHGPLYEGFAPSFSLALWRMVHEGRA